MLCILFYGTDVIIIRYVNPGKFRQNLSPSSLVGIERYLSTNLGATAVIPVAPVATIYIHEYYVSTLKRSGGVGKESMMSFIKDAIAH